MSFACYVFSIGKNVSYISLGTGPLALGTPAFTGGADSVEKPLNSPSSVVKRSPNEWKVDSRPHHIKDVIKMVPDTSLLSAPHI